MAVALPPITSKTNNAPSYVPQQNRNAPEAPTKSGRLPRMGIKKEVELINKRQQLRALQKTLTKAETAEYRYTYEHNLCIDMLKEGFHLSFKEVFELIRRQNQERLAAGPESVMWTQVMLQDEHEKLDMLKLYLSNAESASRRGDFLSVYEARYELACYFQQTKDKWLADHFFKTCLETSSSVTTDGGKTKAEGHCNFGLTLEENSEYYGAAEHFEAYYNLAKEFKDNWVKEDLKRGTISFFTDACIHLYHIYTVIGNELEKADNMEKCVEYHIQALEKAKESMDKKLEGEAAYRLGFTHEAMGSLDTALVHLNTFYNYCRASNDSEGLGRACDAIAKTYARMGVKDQSIEYLKEFVENAEAAGMDAELALACHNLGNIYNSLGNYKDAGEYFNRAYNISRAMGDAESIQINRVQSGIAQAHDMLSMYSIVVEKASGSRDFLERIMDWKSIRSNMYESKADRTGKTAPEPPKIADEETLAEPAEPSQSNNEQEE